MEHIECFWNNFGTTLEQEYPPGNSKNAVCSNVFLFLIITKIKEVYSNVYTK